MRRLRLVHSSAWFERSNLGSPAADGDAAAPPSEPPCEEIAHADRILDPELQAMVEHLRVVTPLPREVRARALARARAAIAAQMSASAAPAPARERHPWLGVLVSFMLGAAVGTAALVKAMPSAPTFGMNAARTP